MRLIVGISGASGVIMGYQMLKALKQLTDMEVHPYQSAALEP